MFLVCIKKMSSSVSNGRYTALAQAAEVELCRFASGSLQFRTVPAKWNVLTIHLIKMNPTAKNANTGY